MAERTHVAVIGAGITGLALGHFLARAGVPHVVLEAADRVGGVIRSAISEGHLLERGPQRMRLTAGLTELIDDLGLRREMILAPPGLPLYVFHRGRLRLVPFSAADFARTDIVSLRAKLRLLAEPFTAGADPAETVADYFTRKVGKDLYENLIGPLYGGLYASDPADMLVGLSLGHVLREFGIDRSLLLPLLRRGGSIKAPPACSFHDGLETLPRALYSANVDNVRLNSSVRALRGGAKWTIEYDGGTVEADNVVLTLAAPAAADLLEATDPQAARSIRELRYNKVTVVHLHAEEPMITGLGYQVALGERLATRGVTFNDNLFDRRGVFTAYLGGAKTPAVAGWSDTEAATVACREFRQVTGANAWPINVTREVMPAWDRSWEAIADLKTPPGLHIAANWHSRPGIPGRLAQAKRLASEFSRDLPASSRKLPGEGRRI